MTQDTDAPVQEAVEQAAEQSQQPQEQQQQQQFVTVQTVEEFAAYVATWHENRINQMAHMQQMPEGTPVAINGGNEVPFTGDLRDGFIAGLNVAISLIQELPFSLVPATAEASNATQH